MRLQFTSRGRKAAFLFFIFLCIFISCSSFLWMLVSTGVFTHFRNMAFGRNGGLHPSRLQIQIAGIAIPLIILISVFRPKKLLVGAMNLGIQPIIVVFLILIAYLFGFNLSHTNPPPPVQVPPVYPAQATQSNWSPKDSDHIAYNSFRVTPLQYSDSDDLIGIVARDYGPSFRIADWQDIIKFQKDISAWADSVGLKEGEDNSFFVTWYSNRHFNSGPRQFFVSRFNGRRPYDYLAHGVIGNNLLCLGSFTKLRYQILIVKK